MSDSTDFRVPALRAPVSVCLASFNGECYIAEQIDSVLAQLLPHDEFIVSDDGSSDQTVDIIQSIGDSRIRLYQNKSSLGVVRNFERALQYAQHDYIFLCDQDDVWFPSKVGRMLAELSVAVMVVSDCRVVDANLQTTRQSFFTLRGSRPGIANNLWRNSYLGCCMAFRRSLLVKALPIPTGAPMHDMWLGLVAQTSGRVTFLPEVLSLYRRHGKAATDSDGVSNYSRWQQLTWRWKLAVALLLRLGLS